jgi:hypothetical protein
MEHPLIGDISKLTTDELGTRVNDLYKKLSIAQRSGNGYLCNQLRMALETFQNAYQARLREQQTQNGNSSPDFNSLINIQ